ncbi:hypothetical protein PNIG_a0930 [Pseudoalteromonas nigrifaciens]|uniref:Uncharacterized protein n=1 Tax=Pseudoalteromonas nigrifaciens TaxID=28109 RepID=A0AAC9UGU6_9GAMM|nr:hypothetical protein PNIG_a0930 [Pseudoalteromonas nigrifaciens]
MSSLHILSIILNDAFSVVFRFSDKQVISQALCITKHCV